MAGIALFGEGSALAQQITPHIGYVYPAGGRQGATVQIVVGGQFLEGATNHVYVSGAGVQATAVDFNKPMPQGQFNLLRDKLKELQDKRAAALKSNRKLRAEASTNTWTAADEKMVEEIRAKILKNPPNRNATVAIAETVTIKVMLAPDAEPGDREIRLWGSGGLSNPMVFRVGQLPEFSKPAAKAPNPEADRFRERFGKAAKPAAAAAPMAVTLPATVNGQILPGGVDRFRFPARAGQQLVVIASARELIPYLADAVPGWFQATLALFDAKGKELAYDDDFRFHPDPVLHYEIPRDGEYTIEIKDAIYRGREDFVYRIALGELPFITSIYPLGGKAGEKTTVELKGWNLPVTSLTNDVREEVTGLQYVSVRKENCRSNRAPFAVDDLPECPEAEPNEQSSTAQPIRLPIIINGRIGKPGDADTFHIEGKAGDVIIAEVEARRLDSSLDSVLRLTDADGKQIAFNDDHEDKASGLHTHHADSLLRATLPASGSYFLQVGDTQRKGGAEFGYRLRVSAPQPDFVLRVVPASITVRPGASVPITVYALRRDGFSNEIALALQGNSAGFSLSGARVPAGQDQIRLTLTAPATATAEPANLSLEGRANLQGKSVTRIATPAEDMMQAFAYRHLVPADELRVAVSGRSFNKAPVKILSATPVRIPAGGIARVQLGVPGKVFLANFDLDLSEPPEGISLQSVAPSGWNTELVLQSDAAKTKPGQAGNLIVNVHAAGKGATASASKGKMKKRGGAVATLPAIPFAIVR